MPSTILAMIDVSAWLAAASGRCSQYRGLPRSRRHHPVHLRDDPLPVRTRDRAVRKRLLEPGIDLAREGLDPTHGLVVLEEPGLPHDQEMPEAADVVVHPLDLREDLIGRASEHAASRE